MECDAIESSNVFIRGPLTVNGVFCHAQQETTRHLRVLCSYREGETEGGREGTQVGELVDCTNILHTKK